MILWPEIEIGQCVLTSRPRSNFDFVGSDIVGQKKSICYRLSVSKNFSIWAHFLYILYPVGSDLYCWRFRINRLSIILLFQFFRPRIVLWYLKNTITVQPIPLPKRPLNFGFSRTTSGWKLLFPKLVRVANRRNRMYWIVYGLDHVDAAQGSRPPSIFVYASLTSMILAHNLYFYTLLIECLYF